MKVRKRNEQRMVIAHPLMGKLVSILIALIITILLIFLVDWPWLVFSFITGLFVLVELINIFKGIIIDKPTETIIVRKLFLGSIPQRRVIPFSAVYCVRLDYVPAYPTPHGGRLEGRKVSLNIGSENIKIEQSENQNSMWALAHEISEFIGCRLEDFSEKRIMAKQPPPSMM